MFSLSQTKPNVSLHLPQHKFKQFKIRVFFENICNLNALLQNKYSARKLNEQNLVNESNTNRLIFGNNCNKEQCKSNAKRLSIKINENTHWMILNVCYFILIKEDRHEKKMNVRRVQHCSKFLIESQIFLQECHCDVSELFLNFIQGCKCAAFFII